MTPFTRRKFTSADGTLPCTIGGEGPLVVLSHAFGSIAWGQPENLTQSFTMVIPEWEEAEFSFGPRASFAWLETLIEEASHENAALVVWSMACPAAVEYAATNTSKLSHLVLVDPAGLNDEFFSFRLSMLPHLLLSRILGRPTRGFIRAMWRNWVFDRTLDVRPLHEAMHRFMIANPYQADVEEDEDDDEDEVEEMIESMIETDVPLLLLTGKHSPIVGSEITASLQNRIPDMKIVEFKQSSHVLQLEEPDRFQLVLSNFLTST